MRKIETKILDSRLGSEWPLPDYATDGAAAIDLRACNIDIDKHLQGHGKGLTISPGERHLIGTGLAIHIVDPNLVGIVASRSGLSLKHGIRIAQGIGVIDADYTGEIKVILQHDGDAPYAIQPGERIAQLFFQPIERVELEPIETFSTTSERGARGFGHTGRA
ncbi:MAG: dUTP diphosphatase [Bacteroidota bacterium]